jgi:hypothetical protein
MLEGWGLPLFPARHTRAKGQTYACDIVVRAFKDGADIDITSVIVEDVWKDWSRRPEIRTSRNKKVRKT